MNPDYLGQFYEQENIREAVRLFMLETLNEQVLDAAFDNGDVTGYKEAREVVDGMFSNLRSLYAKEDKPNKENKAR